MGKRSQALAAQIRQIIAPILVMGPPECGLLSISSVEVSHDFSYATVYYTALEHLELAENFFKERQHELQSSLSILDVHRTPTLRFRPDEGYNKAKRVSELLSKK